MARAKHKPVSALPPQNRPRERFATFGAQNLTEAELLAIILSTGTRKTNVLTLAENILRQLPLRSLQQAALTELTGINGIGKIQAMKVLAALELGRRAATKPSSRTIRSTEDALRELEIIRETKQEHCIGLYLNARHELLETHTVSIGTLNQAHIHPRDVLALALTLPAPYVILAHNHPSGDPTPSQDDLKLTRALQNASHLLGVTLVDHIIVTKDSHISLKHLQLL